MLKRRKQILLRQNQVYIREDEIKIDFDPNEEFKQENDNGELLNGVLNNHDNGTHNLQDESKPPFLTPYENGVVTLPDECCSFPYCRLGCVCDSIAKTDHEQYEKHCRDSGDPDCIFNCVCQLKPRDADNGNGSNNGQPCQPNGKKWTALRDSNNKYRQLRWWKDDDDCGFVPPGSQISLAHNEDGRPKRKSQPPERFRHGFDLDKINLDKDFASSEYPNGNGYYCNGNGENSISKRVKMRSSMTNASTIPNGSKFNHDIRNSLGTDVDRNKLTNGSSSLSLMNKKSSTINNGNRNVSQGSGYFGSSNQFKSGVTQATKGPTNSRFQKKVSNSQKPLKGIVPNPCDNHNHDYNFTSVITGLPLSLVKPSLDVKNTGDAVLVNHNGTVVAIISWTTDMHITPAISKLKFKREHSKKLLGRIYRQPDTSSPNKSTNASPTDVEIHDADLLILLLPYEEESVSKVTSMGSPSSGSTTYSNAICNFATWRFYDLPINYHESRFVIYSELHAMFSVNTLQSKINRITKPRRFGSFTKESGSSGPKIIELNSINLNQPTDPNYSGNVYLLIDSENIIIIGTIPQAYRKKCPTISAASTSSSSSVHPSTSTASC